MKKTVILVIMLVIIAIAFAACGPANSVMGLWYDQAGLTGTIEFKSGGALTMTTMGVSIEGTYTFDAAKGEGTITLSFMGQEDTADFTLSEGKLNIEGQIYTREKVEQQDLGDILG